MSHLYLVTGGDSGPRRDADLVAAFLRGDPAAPGEIWERCYPGVRRMAYRTMGRGQDLDDLVQEVFLRLYRQLRNLRDPSSLRSFSLAITLRVVKGEQRLRWLRRWLGLFDDGHVPDRPSPGTDLDAREVLARFYSILDGLSPRHRIAFVLRHVEGLELTDVAAALGISRATVKRWLPRIVRRVAAQARRDPLLAPYVREDGSLVVRHG